MKMVIFRCKVGINGCVLVNEIWIDTEWSNAAQINALVLVIEVIVAAVVIISHDDKILLLLMVVACGQIQDDSQNKINFWHTS